MTTKIAIESLSMDLKRVALGYYRGSEKMAQRFTEEALKREAEIDYTLVKPYMKKLLYNLKSQLEEGSNEKRAEHSLLLSILLQNYTQTFLR